MATVELQPRVIASTAARVLRTRLPAWLPRALLAVAIAASAGVVLWITRGQTFLGDEWAWFVSYPGFDLNAMIQPDHGGHLTLGLTLFYKGVVEIAGPSSIAFRLALVTMLALCALLFFLLARGRVGDWLALAGSVLILTFGAGGETLGSTLGIGVLGTIALGLGALLLLERNDLIGDLGACALLLVGVASYGPALAFVGGAAVVVLFARGAPQWRRSWVFGIPLVVYGGWRLWAGPGAGGQVTVESVLQLPVSVLDSFAAGLAALSGLLQYPEGGTLGAMSLGWGRPLVLVAIVVGVAIVLARRSSGKPIDRWIWAFAAMPLFYWAMIGVSSSSFREAGAARYQLLSAIFLMLILAQLGAGMKLRRGVTIAILTILVVSVAANLSTLREFGAHFRANSDGNRAQLAGVELARDEINRDLPIEAPGATLTRVPDVLVPIGLYLDATDKHGSPAFKPQQLPELPQALRRAADGQLVRAYDIAPREPTGPTPTGGPVVSLGETGARASSRGDCLRIVPHDQGASATLEVPPGGLKLRTPLATPPTLMVGRFTDPPTIEIPSPIPGRVQVITIPGDADPTPWRLELETVVPLTACSLRGQ